MFRQFKLPPTTTSRVITHIRGGAPIGVYNLDPKTTNIGFDTKDFDLIRVTQDGSEIDFRINRGCPSDNEIKCAIIDSLPIPLPGKQPDNLDALTAPQKIALGYRPVREGNSVVWKMPQ